LLARAITWGGDFLGRGTRFHEADENSATQMAPVMASLRELANAGASVVVLHHKSKSETSSYRGSSDIVAGADAAFALAKRDGLLELRTIKNRFAAETTVEIQPDFAAGTFSVSSATAHQFMPEVARLADVIGSLTRLNPERSYQASRNEPSSRDRTAPPKRREAMAIPERW